MRKIIYTAGVFDLLHNGHLNILERSSELGDLVVGVVSDKGAEAYKRKPIQNEETRLRIIRYLPFVKFALIQDGTDPSSVLRVIRPDVMTHGSDWLFLKEGHDTLNELNIEWKIFPYTKGISTTKICSSIRS